MKPAKEKELRDFQVEIMKSKKQYIAEAMEFRRRIMEFRQRMLKEKERATNVRTKKKLW